MNCFACGSESDLTKHHLVPRTVHAREAKRRNVRKVDLGNLVAMMCIDCHAQLHALISEKELASKYDTVEKIMENEAFAKYAAWKRKRGTTGFRHRASNGKK
jgi:5-methylcytosine-specific restriction enzyme A